MRYVAQSRFGQPMEMSDLNGTSIGSVRRTSWFAIKSAIITANGVDYQATPRGFFQMAVDVTLGDTLICSIQFALMGKTYITTAAGTTYLFKRTNAWRGYYALFSQTDHPIVAIEPHFQLSPLGYRYDIETDDNYAEGRDSLMLMVLLYTINAMQRNRAAVT